MGKGALNCLAWGNAPKEFKRFDPKGLETIPGVLGQAIYGAVTLSGLSLKPKIFESWF